MSLSDSSIIETLPDVNEYDEDLMEEFLWWMCERQKIYIRRSVEGEPEPWTESEILQEYHFCNVHRELDYGTQYALEHILVEDQPVRDVLFNVLLYRFFNRPRTFEMLGGFTKADEFYPEAAVDALDIYSRNNSLFSSAYRVTTHSWANADTKHKNILLGVVRDDILDNLDDYTKRIFGADSLEEAFDVLCEIRGVGDFLAYEIAMDLNYRHLPYSENDFVNIGPGASSGLMSIFGRSGEDLVRWFRMSQDQLFHYFDLQFPYMAGDPYPINKPELTLRDFEHSLCEVNKYWGIKYRDEGRRRFSPRDHAQDRLEDFG